MAKKFFQSLFLLLLLNAVIKPVWIFGIDRKVQLITGTEVYGKYFALFGLTMVFNFLIDLGITVFYNRKAAADHQYIERHFAKAFSLKITLSFLYAIVLVVIGLISRWDDWNMMLWLIINQVMLSFLLFFRANITSLQQYTADAFFSVLDKLIVVIGCLLFIYFPSLFGDINIYIFIYLQVAGASLAALIAFIYVLMKGKTRPELTGKLFDPAYLKETLPYAILIFLMAAHNRMDAFLLERLHPNGAYEAGIYARAFRLLDASNMVGYLTAGFMLPYLSRHYQQQDIRFFVNRILHVLMLLAIMISSCCIIFPDWIDQLLYHSTDHYSSVILSLCLPCIIFYYWIHVFGAVLTAAGIVKSFTTTTLAFVALNTLLNVLFVPLYGAEASAIVALSTQFLYAMAIYLLAVKHAGRIVTPFQFLKYLVMIILSVGLLIATKKLFPSEPIAISSAFVLIIISAMLMKMFSFADIRSLVTIKN